jgi:hypothetical protein
MPERTCKQRLQAVRLTAGLGVWRSNMRATRRKAKPGEVLFFFGRFAGEGKPDHVGMWGGEGATKRHSNAVMYGFTGPRIQDDQTRPIGWKFGNSLLADLEAAGFDIETIEFSIRVKTPNVQLLGRPLDRN